ncbi:MAG: DUF539 domain-containing protein [Proteobacteria bacterium]|jgi:hypothetical protein|nr:DUF539 domain-containing protein [Pseudomonadota bacterium]MDA0995088.1 DUF539 domain-containing protein [Pseudomonadota bacterium]
MNILAITLLLSFAVIVAVIAAMSIGVMNGRPAIRGSCGGLNNGGCELCSGDCTKGKTQ